LWIKVIVDRIVDVMARWLLDESFEIAVRLVFVVTYNVLELLVSGSD
jgi:hypothetical protein